jgi:hypothetical protein
MPSLECVRPTIEHSTLQLEAYLIIIEYFRNVQVLLNTFPNALKDKTIMKHMENAKKYADKLNMLEKDCYSYYQQETEKRNTVIGGRQINGYRILNSSESSKLILACSQIVLPNGQRISQEKVEFDYNPLTGLIEPLSHSHHEEKFTQDGLSCNTIPTSVLKLFKTKLV